MTIIQHNWRILENNINISHSFWNLRDILVIINGKYFYIWFENSILFRNKIRQLWDMNFQT